jgi:hypothetical protein
MVSTTSPLSRILRVYVEIWSIAEDSSKSFGSDEMNLQEACPC